MSDVMWAALDRRRQNLQSFRMMTEFWPAPTKPRRLPVAEVLDEAEWLLANGAMRWEVAQILGRREQTLSRLAYRHGRIQLGTRLGAGREISTEGKVA